MTLSLLATALLMGLAGGPHCVAMCGAVCGSLPRRSAVRADASDPARVAFPVTLRLESATGLAGTRGVDAGAASPGRRWPVLPANLQFQAGRLAGYAAAGAAVAASMQSLGWLADHTAWLRPLWTLLHVAMFAVGAMLLVFARQPPWAERAGRQLWGKVRGMATARGGALALGAVWALMPCGLLYSALMVAALSGSAAGGATFMLAFAAGSGAWLLLAPRLVGALRQHANRWRQDLGGRLAGLVLCAVAGAALWADMARRITAWCA